MLGRSLVGGLVNGLPLAFAGVTVSMFLARSPDATASLGSNLRGAVVGGCLEYRSIIAGLSALALLALVFYPGALLVGLRLGAVHEASPAVSKTAVS